LRWIPTGRIFNTAGLKWVPTGMTFTSSTTKVDCELPNGSNDCITNPYKCDQTLNVSAGTLNLSAGTFCNPEKERLGVCLLKKAPLLKEKKSVRFSAIYLQKKRNLLKVEATLKSAWTEKDQIDNLLKERSVTDGASKVFKFLMNPSRTGGSTQGISNSSVEVLRYDTKGENEKCGNNATEMRIRASTGTNPTREHAEYDESNTYVLERFNTTIGNPIKEILIKLNLPDHWSILTDSKILKDGGEGT
ncbi:hypothetical protein Tco_1233882, partial [Tanacetum coccineum]